MILGLIAKNAGLVLGEKGLKVLMGVHFDACQCSLPTEIAATKPSSSASRAESVI